MNRYCFYIYSWPTLAGPSKNHNQHQHFNNNNLGQPAHNLHKYKFSSMTNLHECQCSDAVRLLAEREFLVTAM